MFLFSLKSFFISQPLSLPVILYSKAEEHERKALNTTAQGVPKTRVNKKQTRENEGLEVLECKKKEKNIVVFRMHHFPDLYHHQRTEFGNL